MNLESYYIYIFLGLFVFILLFWFRHYIRLNDPKIYLVGFLSIVGGIFSATLLLQLLDGSGFDYHTIYYSAMIGPFVEEIFKFMIIIFIVSILKDNTYNPFWGLGVGIMVGLGFGLYENYIYYSSGVDDIMVMIYRFVFVGGMILHPLTSGIAGYMFYISLKAVEYMPKVFMGYKVRFRNVYSIFPLISHIYDNSGRSLKTLFGFIKNVLVLDVTIKYLIGGLKKSKSGFGHGPVEILYEGFFLAVWIHVLYNIILNYMTIPDIFIAIVGICIVIILFKLFCAIYKSDIIGIIMSLIMCAGFVFKNYMIGDNVMMFGLVLLMLSLIMLAISIERRLNYL